MLSLSSLSFDIISRFVPYLVSDVSMVVVKGREGFVWVASQRSALFTSSVMWFRELASCIDVTFFLSRGSDVMISCLWSVSVMSVNLDGLCKS